MKRDLWAHNTPRALWNCFLMPQTNTPKSWGCGGVGVTHREHVKERWKDKQSKKGMKWAPMKNVVTLRLKKYIFGPKIEKIYQLQTIKEHLLLLRPFGNTLNQSWKWILCSFFPRIIAKTLICFSLGFYFKHNYALHSFSDLTSWVSNTFAGHIDAWSDG